MMTDAERALLNEQTMNDEGPDRKVGPWVLDVMSFARRRLVARGGAHMKRVGAPDSEYLGCYIFCMAAPLDVVREAVRSIDGLEVAMDGFLSAVGVALPESVLVPARACFDADMLAIEAATVDVEARKESLGGGKQESAPPN
jgi:hypothetical protein